MIKTVLFVLLFVAMAVAIGLGIWGGIRLYHDAEDGENKPRKGLLVTGITGFITTLALVICIPGSYHQVEQGTVAVVRHLGRITGTRDPGTHFDFYMLNTYETYDTKVQQVKITTSAYSHDAQTMDLEIFLQYQVQTEHIIDIATQYGSLDALQKRIETQTVEKTKQVMSAEHFYDPDPVTHQYPANDFAMRGEEIIRHRADVSNKVSTTVRKAIGDEYYVNVKDVVLTNIDFTDEFEKAVEDKVIAEQEKQAAITRAEAELEVAKLEAQKKIEEARGNAEAQKIIAKAAAEAATYNIVELARVLGYTINETYDYKTTTTTYKYLNAERTALDTTTIVVEMSSYPEEHPELVLTTVTFDNPVNTEAEDARWTKTEEATVLYSTSYTIDLTTGPGEDKFKELVEDYLNELNGEDIGF